MKIICLADDAVQPGSAFRAGHGLAFLVETAGGRILFDTSGSDEILVHNSEVAGVTLAPLSAVVLSHNHWDHTGGLRAVIKRNPGLPVYAHPEALREHFRRKGGKLSAIGLPLPVTWLRERAELRLSEGAQEVLPGVWTTGEIGDRPEPEGRSAHHFLQEGQEWVPDPYRDDLSLVLEAAGGIVLLCGCSHAGILNILLHVERVFDRVPVAVIGGTHLITASDRDLRRVIQVLERLGPPQLYLNHCTGEKALGVLLEVFPDSMRPCPAGTVIEV